MKEPTIRAVCPAFKARADWHGRSYIVCERGKLLFDTRAMRDEYYRAYCCGKCGECAEMEDRHDE